MIYIVTGIHRTGSSMMTRAIALSSGLPTVRNKEIEKIIRAKEADPNYDPNPHGYWVIDPNKTHPWEHDGTLMKCPVYIVRFLPDSIGEYKVILMKRNLAESRASFKKAFNEKIPDNLIQIGDELEQIAPGRPNIDLTVVNYSDVIDDPLKVFTGLKAAGWPIDPQTAANLVEPDLYRVKAPKN